MVPAIAVMAVIPIMPVIPIPRTRPNGGAWEGFKAARISDHTLFPMAGGDQLLTLDIVPVTGGN